MRKKDRNERPENGADAKPCLSDVYKNSTRARRRQADAVLSGRSMVEMLGVLAIIGVLSVGAMSGYSKAIFKYKLNKQAEQTNTIISALFRYQNELRLSPHVENSLQQTELIPILKKLRDIPKEMYISNNETYVNDAFNTKCHAYHRTENNGEYIAYRCILERGEYAFKICQNLYNIAKEWRQNISYISTIAYQGENYNDAAKYYGDRFCSKGVNCLKDITLNDLDQVCRVEKNSDHYSIAIVIMNR